MRLHAQNPTFQQGEGLYVDSGGGGGDGCDLKGTVGIVFNRIDGAGNRDPFRPRPQKINFKLTPEKPRFEMILGMFAEAQGMGRGSLEN